jgi:hypothetical protein
VVKKVMIFGNFETGWDGSICDERHIGEAFKKLGWEVFPVQRECWDDLPDVQPDFILIAQWNGYGDDFLPKLRVKYKVPQVYWAFDYQWDSNEDWHFHMATQVDLFLSKEMDHKEDYEKMGANFYWFPQDFGPDNLDKYLLPLDKKYDVVFTGTYLPQATFRNELLKAVDDSFDLHIFSVTKQAWIDAGFKNVHDAIVDDGLPELYKQARVNISVDWKQADGYWSDRLAQIMMCGGTVINKFVPGQELMYPTVNHFNTIPQCLRMISIFLSVPYISATAAKVDYEYAHKRFRAIDRVNQLVTFLKGTGVIDEHDSII